MAEALREYGDVRGAGAWRAIVTGGAIRAASSRRRRDLAAVVGHARAGIPSEGAGAGVPALRIWVNDGLGDIDAALGGCRPRARRWRGS